MLPYCLSWQVTPPHLSSYFSHSHLKGLSQSHLPHNTLSIILTPFKKCLCQFDKHQNFKRQIRNPSFYLQRLMFSIEKITFIFKSGHSKSYFSLVSQFQQLIVSSNCSVKLPVTGFEPLNVPFQTTLLFKNCRPMSRFEPMTSVVDNSTQSKGKCQENDQEDLNSGWRCIGQ